MGRRFSRAIRAGNPDIRKLLAEHMALLCEQIEKQRRDLIPYQDPFGDNLNIRKVRWYSTLPPEQLYQEVRDKMADLMTANARVRNEMAMELAESFLQAAERGNLEKSLAFIDEGFPVNFQDPITGETALHLAASGGARYLLRMLLRKGQCDFLLRDSQGRFASELAYLYGDDPAVSRLLGIKERRQADKQGIKLTRRPPLAS